MFPAAAWMHGAALHGAGAVAVGALLAFLLLGEPLLGRRSFRAFRAAVDAGDPTARTRFYRRWTLQGWAMTVLALVLTLGVAGWAPAQLGLRAPHLGHGLLGGFLIGMAAAALAGGALGLLLARRRGVSRKRAREAPRGPAAVMALLPRTRAEKRRFAALAVTAGIGEELVWRGVLMAALAALFPAMSAWLLVVLTGLLFGWAHLYQGLAGVLVTALLGTLFAALYLGTGSLLLPMLLHALVDLRALLVRVDGPTGPAPRAPA